VVIKTKLTVQGQLPNARTREGFYPNAVPESVFDPNIETDDTVQGPSRAGLDLVEQSALTTEWVGRTAILEGDVLEAYDISKCVHLSSFGPGSHDTGFRMMLAVVSVRLPQRTSSSLSTSPVITPSVRLPQRTSSSSPCSLRRSRCHHIRPPSATNFELQPMLFAKVEMSPENDVESLKVMVIIGSHGDSCTSRS